MMYAHDIILCVPTSGRLVKNIIIWKGELLKYDMKNNTKQTEIKDVETEPWQLGAVDHIQLQFATSGQY